MKLYLRSLVIFLIFTAQIFAQDPIPETLVKGKLIIGLTETPPFVMEEKGKIFGLSISSWELVNEEMGMEYEYIFYPSLVELLAAVERAEVDLSINPVTVTRRRMERMDFSQPYFISHTAVAKKNETMIWTYLANILSWNFISAILILLGIIFLFGFLVWIFERKKNKEEFGSGIKGIFQGFWWSAVTMTTVGYGDKSPITLGGRFIGLIWMFMAIIMISSLTAGIASSLTVQNISDEIVSVQDLNRFEVITVTGSSALELLDQYNIQSEEVANAKEGIAMIREKDQALFIYDEPILKYHIDNEELQDEVQILQHTLKRDYYSYSFPKNSPLIEQIDPVLIAALKSMEWNNLIREYK